jgi:hypothetical protein
MLTMQQQGLWPPCRVPFLRPYVDPVYSSCSILSPFISPDELGRGYMAARVSQFCLLRLRHTFSFGPSEGTMAGRRKSCQGYERKQSLRMYRVQEPFLYRLRFVRS